MFEKRKQVKMPFDESNLEELTDPRKFKYATRIYLKSYGELFVLNSIGVITKEISNELVTTLVLSDIHHLVLEKKAKLYRLKILEDVD
jgi:hypothetical protein